MSVENNSKRSRNRNFSDADTEKSLYSKQQKIYPREVHGLFKNLRVTAIAILLGIFYGLPWLRWDDHQAVLLDLPNRKFQLFSLTLWPQDFIFLAFLLIIASLCLFFFTALAGRLWCGYACPQTVWTEVFLWMERWVEGDRNKAMKLDKASMSFAKFKIKFSKQFLWITFSLFTGFTFVSFFTPQTELFSKLLTMEMGPWETFWMFFYGFATYGNAGYMREQICIYMCPYARFQSAMFDNDTLVISYDEKRGESRGPRKRSVDPKEAGLGDCIDCTMCVQVCPTGIDIRNGLQYECIGCSACIDVCDSVMDKMGYEKGLIKYTTQHAIEGNETHVFRPRVFIYAIILLSLIGILLYSVITRSPIALDVIRDRNQLYREISGGQIENVYTLKIMNMDDISHKYSLVADGIDGIQLMMDEPVIYVETGIVAEVPVRIRVSEDDLDKRSTKIEFTLTAQDTDELQAIEEARFLGPLP